MPPPDRPPVFTREAVREVDRRAIAEFGIPGIVLMENAASALASAAQEMIAQSNCDGALILAGPGNNGGDGAALARKLHNAGIPVVIALAADPGRIKGDARTNLDIAQAMRLPIIHVTDASRLDAARSAAGANPLLIDALLGTGLTTNVRGLIAGAIAWANAQGVPILAVDLPSGLDCDTGAPLGDAIRAMRTVTLVGWKKGFTNPDSRQHTGAITVGDIGAPVELIRNLSEAS